MSLLNQRVVLELELARRGLMIAMRLVANFWSMVGPRSLLMPYRVVARQKAIAAYSTANAGCLPELETVVERAAGHLRELALRTPPDAGSGCSEMLRKAGLAGKIARIDLEDQKLLLNLFTKSAADDPASFFRKRRREGAFAFAGVVGAYDSPSTPGTACPLLHNCFGQVNGKSGV